MAHADYRFIDIPEDRPKPDWTTEERRAYILERMVEVGYPDALCQADIAREFDITRQSVHDDFNILRDQFKTVVTESDKADVVGMAKRTLRRAYLDDDIAQKEKMRIISEYADLMGLSAPEKLEMKQESEVSSKGDISINWSTVEGDEDE